MAFRVRGERRRGERERGERGVGGRECFRSLGQRRVNPKCDQEKMQLCLQVSGGPPARPFFRSWAVNFDNLWP